MKFGSGFRFGCGGLVRIWVREGSLLLVEPGPGFVVDALGVLLGVVRAEPDPTLSNRIANLSRPFPPLPLPHALVLRFSRLGIGTRLRFLGISTAADERSGFGFAWDPDHLSVPLPFRSVRFVGGRFRQIWIVERDGDLPSNRSRPFRRRWPCNSRLSSLSSTVASASPPLSPLFFFFRRY
jgi:hypothetical protein